MIKRLILALCLMFGCASASATEQPCDQTFSNSTGLATAIGNAANGTVICLNNGTYGSVDIFDKTRTGYVTVRSTSGTGASISPQVGNSRYIRFLNLTIGGGLTINSCSLNIQFVNSVLAGGTDGIAFDGSSCPSTTQNYLVDGVDFTNTGQANYEGRLNCRDCNGVVIRNSTFAGVVSGNASDGIQTQGNTQNLTIGPGNIFDGILESLCGATHCDAIQLQGGGATVITGNWFKNGDTYLMSPDGCSNVTFENNILDGAAASYQYKFQMGSCSNPIFRHNTLYQVGIAVDSKVGEAASTNALIENNIFTGALTDIKTSGGSGCTSCTIQYNQFGSGTTAQGTNTIAGSPTYTAGGTNPGTWSGWKLTSGSTGHLAGNDSRDTGSRYFRPAAPGNIR